MIQSIEHFSQGKESEVFNTLVIEILMNQVNTSPEVVEEERG